MKTKLIVLLIVTLMAKIQAQNAKIPYLLTSLYERQIENNLQETIIINGVETPIYLNNINIQDYIHFELLDETNNIETLFGQMITEWDSSYSLKLAIDTDNPNIDVQFIDNYIIEC